MNPRKFIPTISALFAIFSLASCATYTISNEKLAEQMSSAVPKEGTFTYTYVPVGVGAGGVIGGAVGGAISAMFQFKQVMNNGIRTLVVQDKNGHEAKITPDQRTQIRLYRKDGDYSTFYFDTMFMNDRWWGGARTHFFPSAIKPIPFSQVSKIEIQ